VFSPQLRPFCGLLGLSLLACGGCVSQAVVHDVHVTAGIRHAAAQPGTFRIVSQPITPDDAKPTGEAIALLRRGLVAKGYREAAGASEPDRIITVSCGASGPSIQRTTEREPIYRVVQAPSRYERVQVGNTPGGAPLYEMRLVESPAIRKLAGYRDVPRATKVFKKYLRLSAHDNRAGPTPTAPTDDWTIESVSEEPGSSVSEIVPVLTAASLVYLGKETTGTEIMHLSDTDQDVAALRRGH
jgi:hypothetical protein